MNQHNDHRSYPSLKSTREIVVIRMDGWPEKKEADSPSSHQLMTVDEAEESKQQF